MTDPFDFYYDRSGNPITLHQWGELQRRNPGYKRIALTTVTDTADPARTYSVSTVWLGIDHSYILGGPPIIFETMVFTDDHDDELHCEYERYATETQARDGHTRMVTRVAASLTDPVVMDATETG